MPKPNAVCPENREVAVLPDWLISPHEKKLGIKGVTISELGLVKSVNIGVRNEDLLLDYVQGFIASENL